MNLYITPLTKVFFFYKNILNVYIYIFNKNYYFSILYKTQYFLFDKELGILIFKKELNEVNSMKIVVNLVNNFLFLWDYYFFNKISIKGKSFKLKKKKKYINYILNTSHFIWSYSTLHLVKKIKKSKLIFFFTNEKKFNKFLYKVINYRLTNIFTKRGLRLNRMKIFKKKGKTNMKI